MEIFKKAIIGNDILRVLHIKSFFLILVSQFLSNLAFNMQHFVLIFIIYGLTRSNTAVSAVILSFTIPAILFSLISGVHVDRWDKRKILFFTNLIRGILILLFLVPGLHVGFMYTITFLIALATQFFIPAGSAAVPLLVPQRLIMSANSILYLGVYATMFLGYIFAGSFLLILGKDITIVFLAALFFASAFFILPIKPQYRNRDTKSKDTETSFFRELHEILPFIKKTKKVVQALVVLTIAQAIIFMFAVLGPGYVATILKIEVERLSLILIAPAALGMMIGAFLLGSFGKKLVFKWHTAVGFLLSGVIFALFSQGEKIASNLPVIIIFSILIGFAISLIFIPGHATLQSETTERLRGRIYGLLNALTGVVSFLPVILAGGFADLLGVGSVVFGVSILMLIVSGFFFFFA